jgi:hypothetical protein
MRNTSLLTDLSSYLFMKRSISVLICALLFTAPALHALSQEAVSMDFFYNNLANQGNWQDVGQYGYCWQPANVGSDWQPYSDGRWVYTDAGWTWDSYESFGWAVYHYGRWVNTNQIGWVWVPGTQWGPGWVSWRHSSQYVGWAPLPPEALFMRALGLSGWVDDYYNIGPNNYRFVENRNFGARRMGSVFIDQRQNVSIIHQTTNITNITYINNVVHNGGLGFDQQSRQSKDPLHRYKLDRRQDFDHQVQRQSDDRLKSRIDGDSLSVLALPFTHQSSDTPQKLSKRLPQAEVNHGWANAGSKSEIADLRAKLKHQTKAPNQLPPPKVFEKVPTEPRTERDPRMPNQRPTVQTKPPVNTMPKKKGDPDQQDRPPTAQKKPNAADTPPTSKAPVPMPPVQKPADRANPGGRNKTVNPQLSGTETRPQPKIEANPKTKDRVPQTAAPVTPRPRVKPQPGLPRITPQKPEQPRPQPQGPSPEPRPPQIQKPTMPARAPAKVAPPRPEKSRQPESPAKNNPKKPNHQPPRQ